MSKGGGGRGGTVRGQRRNEGVLVAGYYGLGNLGDEAILSSLLHDLTSLLPEHHFRVLTAGNARAGEAGKAGGSGKSGKAVGSGKVVDRGRVTYLPRLQPHAILAALRRSRLLVLGGGSLIQDSTSLRSLLYYLGLIWLAKSLGLQVAIYGGGIGPVSTPRGRRMAGAVLPRVDLLALRDRRSMETALSLGVAADRLLLAADPAFAAPAAGPEALPAPELVDRMLDASGVPTSGARVGQGLMGISLRPPMTGADVAAVAAAVDAVAGRHGLFPLFLPLHPEHDTPTLRAVAGLMRSPSAVLQGVTDPDILRGVMGRLRLAMCMRLHAVIFAVTAGVPCVALAYDPKVDALAEDVPDIACVTYPGVVVSEVETTIERLLRDEDSLRPALFAASGRLAERARSNAIAVACLLRETSWR